MPGGVGLGCRETFSLSNSTDPEGVTTAWTQPLAKTFLDISMPTVRMAIFPLGHMNYVAMQLIRIFLLVVFLSGCATTSDPVVKEASYAIPPAPKYPASARRLEVEGLVQLRVNVLASGLPGSVEILKAPEAARSMLRRLKASKVPDLFPHVPPLAKAWIRGWSLQFALCLIARLPPLGRAPTLEENLDDCIWTLPST